MGRVPEIQVSELIIEQWAWSHKLEQWFSSFPPQIFYYLEKGSKIHIQQYSAYQKIWNVLKIINK